MRINGCAQSICLQMRTKTVVSACAVSENIKQAHFVLSICIFRRMGTLWPLTRDTLRRTFDIREGEGRRAILLQVHIFLVISTLLIVKPTANGLFLASFGVENLPYAFVLVAIAAAIVSSLYARYLRSVSLLRMMHVTIISSAVTLLFFGIALRFNVFEGPVLYLFYIFVAIFALLATSQFWVLASFVFNAREAKRLFGFIGAGAIAGGVFGGYLTSVLTNWFSSEYMLFVAAGLLLCCIPVYRAVWPGGSTVQQTPKRRRRQFWKFGGHPVSLIRRSRHLTLLTGIVAVSVIVAKFVDFQFAGIASAHITDADALTAFFGFWFSTFNLVSLALQLFLTRRVVGTFGVGSSLFFLPVLIFGATIFLLIFPELLLAAIVLKMTDGSLKQSINRAAIELIILPIPIEVKNQSKTFIDVFVDSLATGVSGLMLIFLIRGLDLSTSAVSLLILGFVILWIYLAIQMRRQYVLSFKSRIIQATGPSQNTYKRFDISSESEIKGFRKVLKSGSERQIIHLLQMIRELQDDRLYEAVEGLLKHSSANVRAEALRYLYYLRKTIHIEEVEYLTRDTDQDVRIEAFRYLFRHTPENLQALMRRYLKDEDYKVRSAALVSLAVETKNNPRLRQIFHLRERLLNRKEKLENCSDPEERNFRTVGLLQAIGHANIPELYTFIDACLKSGVDAIRRQALLSAAQTGRLHYIQILLPFLAEDELRETAVQAIRMYGVRVVGMLETLVEEDKIDTVTIRHIPAVLRGIGTQRSVDFLLGLLDSSDLKTRNAALRALNALKQVYPHLGFDRKHIVRRILDEAQLFQETLSFLYAQLKADRQEGGDPESQMRKRRDARKSLVTLLERRLDNNLERIFRLLGLRYPADDIVAIFRSIQSTKPDMRLNALEYLDNLLEPNLKKILIPIIETTMLETITADAIRYLNLQIPDEYDCYEILLESQDTRLKMEVLYLLGQLQDPRYLPLLEKVAASEDSSLQGFAHKIIQEVYKT